MKNRRHIGVAAAIGMAVLSASPSAVSAAATAPKDCLLVVEETAGSLAIVGTDGALRKRLPLGERPHEVEVSPDRKIAYVSMFGITDYDSQLGTPGTMVAKIDLARARKIGELTLPADVRAPHGVKLRPPAYRELYVNAEAGGDTMLVFDSATDQLLRRFPLPPGTHNFVFSNDGSALFSFAGAKGVAKLDAATGKVLAKRDLGPVIRGIMLTSRGTVIASGRGLLYELKAADLSDVGLLPAPVGGQFLYVAQFDNGTLVAPSLDDNGVAYFTADEWPATFVRTGKTAIRALRGPDGLVYVANVNDDHVSVLGADGTVHKAIGGLTSPNGLGFGTCPRR